MIESGNDQVDPASAFAPVASALHHVTGETNFIQVFPSTQQILPTFHLADVPIDTNVSPKLRLKFGLTNSEKPKVIPHIAAWTSAFQIFVGLYMLNFHWMQ